VARSVHERGQLAAKVLRPFAAPGAAPAASEGESTEGH
jgi:hypothetical protein